MAQVAAPGPMQSELLGGQSDLIKRVEELRTMYRSHRDQLGVRAERFVMATHHSAQDGFSVLRSRGAFGNLRKDDDAVHAPATRSQDESSSDESEKRAKRVAVAAAMRAKYFMDNVDAVQLQTVVRQSIAEHGGSSHLDTIVEYVRMVRLHHPLSHIASHLTRSLLISVGLIFAVAMAHTTA